MLHMTTLSLGAYQTNCYIVWGEGSQTCVVIDPGSEAERVLTQTEKLGLSIEAILLTHGHFDHVGGVRQLAADTGCAVCLNPKDTAMPPAFTAGALYYTNAYSDGDRLTLAGLNITVLETPGHTPGSVCLLCDQVLFSGDTLFAGSCGRTDLPGGSWESLRSSLSRLRSLPDNLTVCPGHGGSSTLAEEKAQNPYL